MPLAERDGPNNYGRLAIRPGRRTPIDPAIVEKRKSIPPPPIDRANNYAAYGGVANPYGDTLKAYEPDTEVFTPDPGSDNPLLRGYADAYNASHESDKPDELDTAPAIAEPTQDYSDITATTIAGIRANGQGSVANVIAAAKSMLGTPYVWGGSTSRGVDCSGLIAFAFRQAGINMPRYRAEDYGRLGESVSQDQARAGDLVYWDHEGSTDHVGIYLGNGMVIQAPKTGDVVKVSKVWGNAQYKRILNDKAFGQAATPTGGAVTSYGGQPADNTFLRGVSVASPVHINWRKGQTE